MPEIACTCALPTYNSAAILWLQLESLCRQETQYAWELLLAEEDSPDYAGRRFVDAYRARLEEAGCRSVVHYHFPRKVHLVEKWRFLGGQASEASRMVLFCASDNYSPPSRIELAMTAEHLGFDWVDQSRGYFYDIASGKMALWQRPAPERSGLFMATRTEYVRALPESDLTRNIDGFIKEFTRHRLGRALRHFRDVWTTRGLHTDGCNQISHHRAGLYNTSEMKGPFQPCALDSPSALLPAEVAYGLERLASQVANRRAQSPLRLEPVL